MSRLLLLRHAPTSATRRRAFPVDEPLDARGREAARALRGTLPGADRVDCAPARRCRETTRAAGLDHAVPLRIEPRAAECDFGAWSGRDLSTVHAEEPDALAAWMTDPRAAPPGGESLLDLLARVGAWLTERAADSGTTVAVTHGGVVRAAVVHALAAPPLAVWRVGVAPLSLTELRAHDGEWTLHGLAAPAVDGAAA